MNSTIGIVGLGQMGWRMAARLCAAGKQVIAGDSNPSTISAFVEKYGAVPGDDLSRYQEADIVILMLPNSDIVCEVLIGANPLTAHLKPGCLIIDMGSSDPAVYEDVVPILDHHGQSIIDAPVSGNITGAEAGTLTIMAGGIDADINRAMAVFDILGKQVFRTGKLGNGQSMKALNNLASAGALMLTIEVLITAQRAGLDPAQVNSILNVSTGRNNSTDRKIDPFVLSRAFNSGFGLSLMAKDLRTAGALAERTDTKTQLSKLSIEMANAAERSLGAGADHTAVAKWIEGAVGEELAQKF